MKPPAPALVDASHDFARDRTPDDAWAILLASVVEVAGYRREGWEFTVSDGSSFSLIKDANVSSFSTESVYGLFPLSGPILDQPGVLLYNAIASAWASTFRLYAHKALDGHHYLVEPVPSLSSAPFDLGWEVRVLAGRLLCPELDLRIPSEALLTAVLFCEDMKRLRSTQPTQALHRIYYAALLERYSAAQIELGAKLWDRDCAPEEIWALVKDL